MWQAIVTLVAVIVGASLGYVFQRAQARSSYKSDWANRGAEALADAEMLLTEVKPDGLAVKAQYGSARGAVVALREIESRSTNVRRAVAVLAAGHPDPEVREDARKLEEGLRETVENVGFVVHFIGHPDEIGDNEGAMDSIRGMAEESWKTSRSLTTQGIGRLHK